MDRFYLGLICASAALLVGAIIAVSPSIKSDADSSNPVVRLLQPSPQRPATPHRWSPNQVVRDNFREVAGAIPDAPARQQKV